MKLLSMLGLLLLSLLLLTLLLLSLLNLLLLSLLNLLLLIVTSSSHLLLPYAQASISTEEGRKEDLVSRIGR